MKKQIIIAILSFCLCVVVGYFGTSLVRQLFENTDAPGATTAAVTGAGTGTDITAPEKKKVPVAAVIDEMPVQKTDSIQPESSVPASDYGAVSVSQPVYDEITGKYSFSVDVPGLVVGYVLLNSKKEEILTQSEPDFIVSAGTYYVRVIRPNGEVSEDYEVKGCYRKVKKITVEELDSVLNSKDENAPVLADFKNRVAGRCKYSFIGLDPEEGPAPVSHMEIINRISMKTWTSVTVTSVRYNQNTNQLVYVEMKVNY